ncbi:DUF3099 family protein [Actinocorallia herbida]|uniref:DUF3099 family protein n=2 Tax=Actinocorallia herbida TaxID=58109 RepID=A0A3N1D0V6_9ACTN|nr:DUF3099 family protein [Actinocorallia herbida]
METRKRNYLIMMAVCLTLLVIACVVAIFSPELGVVVALVACVFPPLAAILGNDAEADDARPEWDDDLERWAQTEIERRKVDH